MVGLSASFRRKRPAETGATSRLRAIGSSTLTADRFIPAWSLPQPIAWDLRSTARERWELLLAVKERLDDQFGVLTNAVVSEAGPDAEVTQRIEDLQFELRLLEEACEEAEQKYLTHAHDSNPTTKGEDNG